MPLVKYCDCGHPNLYTLEVPIFCGSCGTKFGNSVSIANQKPKIKPLIKEVIEDDNEDIETEENLDINIDALELEVPIDKEKDRKITLGEVIKQQKTGFVREKPKKVNKKKEFQEFLESAKNTNKPIEINDGSGE